MSYAKIFGKNLRICRVMRRLSQSHFSARLDGISVSYISNLENGKENPTLKQLERIASALGMPLEAMFDPQMIHQPATEDD